MKVTGAIIAKNEAKYIKNAVTSLQAICEQIIVVDTGSDDDTAVIASSLGCEVFFKKWCDDFSEARNYALEFVRNEWVIFIDADESLASFQHPALQKLLNDKQVGGISCILKNYTNAQLTTFTEHRYTRIFRRQPNIRYSGKIHEQIADSIIKSGYSIIESDIIIEHFGYIDSSAEKKDRNKKLLYEEFQKNPTDWHKFHIANTEFALGNLNEAKELYSAILQSSELSEDSKELSLLRLHQIALKLDDYGYIEKNLNVKFKNMNYEGLRLFIASAYYLQIGELSKAYSSSLSAKSCNSSLVDANLLDKSIAVLHQNINKFR